MSSKKKTYFAAIFDEKTPMLMADESILSPLLPRIRFDQAFFSLTPYRPGAGYLLSCVSSAHFHQLMPRLKKLREYHKHSLPLVLLFTKKAKDLPFLSVMFS